MTTWSRYVYKEHLIHVVCSDLEAQLVAEMAARGGVLVDDPAFVETYGNPWMITEWCIDVGGPALMSRPYIEFQWHGLEMSVPCEQVDRVINEVLLLRQRRFEDGSAYFKLKLWHHALVMTTDMKADLERALVARRREAAERASTSLAEVDRRREAMLADDGLN